MRHVLWRAPWGEMPGARTVNRVRTRAEDVGLLRAVPIAVEGRPLLDVVLLLVEALEEGTYVVERDVGDLHIGCMCSY